MISTNQNGHHGSEKNRTVLSKASLFPTLAKAIGALGCFGGKERSCSAAWNSSHTNCNYCMPALFEMGWMESPQSPILTVCMNTETGRDLIPDPMAHDVLDPKIDCPRHPLEKFLLSGDLLETTVTPSASATTAAIETDSPAMTGRPPI